VVLGASAHAWFEVRCTNRRFPSIAGNMRPWGTRAMPTVAVPTPSPYASRRKADETLLGEILIKGERVAHHPW